MPPLQALGRLACLCYSVYLRPNNKTSGLLWTGFGESGQKAYLLPALKNVNSSYSRLFFQSQKVIKNAACAKDAEVKRFAFFKRTQFYSVEIRRDPIL